VEVIIIGKYDVYTDIELDNSVLRIFDNFKDSDLVWHRDKEDRIVILLYKGDENILLYMDNQVPIIMNINQEYTIPKEVWHKVKAKYKFTILIIKH
jgi:phage FluMu gp28-like protein